MGDMEQRLIPDAVKYKADVAVGGSALIGYMGAIPWPTIAAFLSSLYIGLRIVEMVVGWMRKKKPK